MYSDTTGLTRHDESRLVWVIGWATCSMMLIIYLVAPLLFCARFPAALLQDDAFYYLVTAEHLAATGRSTFDTVSETNGYHPLWLMIVTALQLLDLKGIIAVYILQALINTITLLIILKLVKPSNITAVIFIFCAYLFGLAPIAMSGMEADICILAFVIFLWLLYRPHASLVSGGLMAGLAASLCVAARLDCAVFVLPILALSPLPLRSKAIASAVILLMSALYIGFNLSHFGMATPVSGAVKTLGGFHINMAVIREMTWIWPLKNLLYLYHFWLVWLLVVFLLVSLTTRGRDRALSFAFLLGLTAFLARQLFFSSWLIWPWYCYPVALGLIILSMIYLRSGSGGTAAATPPTPLPLPVFALFFVISLLACRIVSHSLVRTMEADATLSGGFARINALAAEFLNQHAPGQRVAMGDRAGSLAYFYSGGVVQLEGLMNDAAYLRSLQRDEDPTPLLCQRGVRYLIAYQQDLGAYHDARIPVLHSVLTDYRPIPEISVDRVDEVARFQDLRIYDNRSWGDIGDNYLYIWRLSACQRNSSTP